MAEACFNCRFFEDIDPGGGLCRSLPPKVFIVPGDDDPVKALWPRVSHDDWCGKREPDERGAYEKPPAEVMQPPFDEPCAECGSLDGKEYFKAGMSGDCPTCGATDEIPF